MASNARCVLVWRHCWPVPHPPVLCQGAEKSSVRYRTNPVLCRSTHRPGGRVETSRIRRRGNHNDARQDAGRHAWRTSRFAPPYHSWPPFWARGTGMSKKIRWGR
jgi:hypothetical protein